MPGRLVMDVKEPNSPPGLKRDASHLSVHQDQPALKRFAQDGFAHSPKANGLAASDPPTNGSLARPTNGFPPPDLKVKDGPVDEVPQLEQFRETLVPFGKMLQRMAQQTYFDLSELIDALADVPLQPQPQLTNGHIGQVPPDKSQASVDKKLRLLNFAQTHKDRFIKALVLSDWARNMDDMAQLIDVSMFLRQQDWATSAAADSIYRVKENMAGAKMPNPNIEGALEILTTGKAPWMPDLGYIPPDPLTAGELLEALSDMDFALSVRLNLHENLPKRLRDYSIANGRATFKVHGEFEVDLAIADEEPESPFYFIDLRFLFTPTTDLSNDRLRTHLEAQVNTVLLAEGLAGCDKFLHGFVLTHKIGVLRSQALELMRGKWIDNIDVQLIHRSLIIQYWKEQPGGKNWIELGIASGEKPDVETPTDQPSRIQCRWFRRGQEALDHDLSFDLDRLSAAAIIEEVVARHSYGRLNALADGLVPLAEGTTAFSVDLQSASQQSQCKLKLSLLPLSSPVAITIEPVTGVYAVRSGNVVSDLDFATRLNAAPHPELAAIVRRRLCRMLVHEIQQAAELVGLVNIDLRNNAVAKLRHEPVVLVSFDRRAASDSEAAPCFVLTATADLYSGITWFVGRTQTIKDDTFITEMQELQAPEGSEHLGPRQLLQIEQRMKLQATAKTLESEIRSSSVRVTRAGSTPEQEKGATSTLLYVDMASLLKTRKASPVSASDSPFSSTGSLVYDAASGDTQQGWSMQYTLRTKLRKPASDMITARARHAFGSRPGIHIGPHGELSASVRASIGEAVLPRLRSTLLEVERLLALLQISRQNHFAVLTANPSKLHIQYTPALSCAIEFDPSSAVASLDFSSTDPSTPNPHARFKAAYTRLLTPSPSNTNTDDNTPTKRFACFAQLLHFTLPLLQTVQRLILDPASAPDRILLTAHTATIYRLHRHLPSGQHPPLKLALQIRARAADRAPHWSVKVLDARGLGEAARQRVGALMRDSDGGWRGLRNMVVAGPEGVAEFVRRVEAVCAGDAEGHKGREIVVLD